MNVEIRDNQFINVVDPKVEIQKLATGFKFTEEAVWDHSGNALIFSDMPGNIMRKWTDKYGIESFREPSSMANENFLMLMDVS